MAAATSDHELIRNTIAYCNIAADLKDWPLMSRSFTDDCAIDYPPPLGSCSGLDDFTLKVKALIGEVQTQHFLSTQAIEVTGETTATATTYAQGYHWRGDRRLVASGRYEDKLVKVRNVWLIKERKFVGMGKPEGDPSILADAEGGKQ